MIKSVSLVAGAAGTSGCVEGLAERVDGNADSVDGVPEEGALQACLGSPVPAFAAGVGGHKSVLRGQLAAAFSQHEAVIAAGAPKAFVGFAAV